MRAAQLRQNILDEKGLWTHVVIEKPSEHGLRGPHVLIWLSNSTPHRTDEHIIACLLTKDPIRRNHIITIVFLKPDMMNIRHEKTLDNIYYCTHPLLIPLMWLIFKGREPFPNTWRIHIPTTLHPKKKIAVAFEWLNIPGLFALACMSWYFHEPPLETLIMIKFQAWRWKAIRNHNFEVTFQDGIWLVGGWLIWWLQIFLSQKVSSKTEKRVGKWLVSANWTKNIVKHLVPLRIRLEILINHEQIDILFLCA